MSDDLTRHVLHKSIPAAPRWFSVGACAIAAAFFVGAFISDFASANAAVDGSTWGLLFAAVLSAGAAGMLLKAGVYLRVVGSRVEMGLRPLRRARFETSEVMDIEMMEVPELAREWGTRGHARGENGLLFAVGGLRKALMFTLRDGRKFGITVEGSEQLVLDILALGSDIANQNS